MLTAGKVKDIYDAGEGLLRFHFSDRVSAYDVKFADTIPRKGEVLCKFADYWFNTLDAPNHFVERTSDTDIIVKRMEMIPMECVVRGYLYGSLYDRYVGGAKIPDVGEPVLAARLDKPIFDPTTKSEHDIPVDRDSAIRMELVDDSQYDTLERITLDIYEKMSARAADAGFIMADLKLEFGILDGKITLGDSIGPDECRLWPTDSYEQGRTQETYDKQILRDWLSAGGYKKRFEDDRAAGRTPVAPGIPADIVEKMSQRYVDAYARIAGRPL